MNTLLIPTTKRDARRRYTAGLVIGVTNDRYPDGLYGHGFTKAIMDNISFDDLVSISVDSRRPSCVFWFRPADTAL